MAVSTHKKIVLRRFDREPLLGFVNPQTWLRDDGLELLTQSGAIAVVPYGEVKLACFVRDFNNVEVAATEPQLFHTRPKMSGLWVRMRFRDGELMDGVLANNLLAWESYGFTLVPPSPTSGNQRVFVPRAALEEIQVVGVVGSPLRQKEPAKAKPKDQIELFE